MKNASLNIFGKILIFVLSLGFSLIIIALTYNYYLTVNAKGLSPRYSLWTLEFTNYHYKYVYWSKSWCQLMPDQCNNPEEQLAVGPIETYKPHQNQEPCKNIVFLGDSFTIAPWTETGKSFASTFVSHLSEHHQTCYRLIRIASGGSGTSQQLAFFEDHLKHLNPQIVIWQYFVNDYYDNNFNAVHIIKNGNLRKINALDNFLYWSGFLNQHIPFLKDSTLGNHLMYLGEAKNVFHNWAVDPTDQQAMISYNRTFIRELLLHMQQLAIQHNFTTFTTLSPLECLHVIEHDCSWNKIYHNDLKNLLKTNSNFIEMEYKTVDLLGNILGITNENNKSYFNQENDAALPGSRHLSQLGNLHFGQILYYNFIENYE